MKLSYNSRIQQYTVTVWNPETRRIELIDSDASLDALGTRTGFLSDDDDEDLALEEEETADPQ